MKNGREWSLDVTPVYEHFEPYEHVTGSYFFDSVLRHVRVAVKSGPREVLIFHAVRPAPPSDDESENYFFTYKRMVDPYDNPHSLDLNPLKQLLADAELGRKVREAGLELK